MRPPCVLARRLRSSRAHARAHETQARGSQLPGQGRLVLTRRDTLPLSSTRNLCHPALIGARIANAARASDGMPIMRRMESMSPIDPTSARGAGAREAMARPRFAGAARLPEIARVIATAWALIACAAAPAHPARMPELPLPAREIHPPLPIPGEPWIWTAWPLVAPPSLARNPAEDGALVPGEDRALTALGAAWVGEGAPAAGEGLLVDLSEHALLARDRASASLVLGAALLERGEGARAAEAFAAAAEQRGGEGIEGGRHPLDGTFDELSRGDLLHVVLVDEIETVGELLELGEYTRRLCVEGLRMLQEQQADEPCHYEARQDCLHVSHGLPFFQEVLHSASSYSISLMSVK